MTNPSSPEAATMLFADCPLCDAPATLDADASTLDCPTCAMSFMLADDRALRELAVAA